MPNYLFYRSVSISIQNLLYKHSNQIHAYNNRIVAGILDQELLDLETFPKVCCMVYSSKGSSLISVDTLTQNISK